MCLYSDCCLLSDLLNTVCDRYHSASSVLFSFRKSSFFFFFECYTVVSMGALSVRVLLYVVLCFHVFHVLTELMFY